LHQLVPAGIVGVIACLRHCGALGDLNGMAPPVPSAMGVLTPDVTTGGPMYQEQPIGWDPISVNPHRPFLLSL